MNFFSYKFFIKLVNHTWLKKFSQYTRTNPFFIIVLIMMFFYFMLSGEFFFWRTTVSSTREQRWRGFSFFFFFKAWHFYCATQTWFLDIAVKMTLKTTKKSEILTTASERFTTWVYIKVKGVLKKKGGEGGGKFFLVSYTPVDYQLRKHKCW